MKFFSLENPIWKFIGNLADFFLLSCLWYLCCLPVVTAGAATTALYYVTLKMARGQEGQLIPAFFHSFKQNLKQATALWVGVLGGWHPSGTGSGDLPADQFGVCGGQCFLPA